ncbi:MAG: integrase, partial [Gemmatimonadales bacterium]|nr:integrase [Gemmatimonadales bacterium]
MKSYNVRFWNISVQKGRKRPFVLRWVVEGDVQTRSFTTRALADSYKAQLIQAARRGEAFNTDTGLPESMERRSKEISWYDLARAYVDDRWSKVSGRQRKSVAETLVAVTPVLITEVRGMPEKNVLRDALWQHAFTKESPDVAHASEVAEALQWIAKASVPVADLMEYRTVTKALEACARNLDGTASAPGYYSRRRRV